MPGQARQGFTQPHCTFEHSNIPVFYYRVHVSHLCPVVNRGIPVKLNTEFIINQVYGTNTWVCRVMCILYTFTTITMNSPLSSYKTILFHWSFPRRLFRFRIVVITFALVVLMFRPSIGQFFFQFFCHFCLTHNGCGIF